MVVVSYAYWQNRLASDPAAIGQPLTVNGQVMTIVGVAPRGFSGTTLGIKPAVFAPITMRGFSDPFKDFDNRRSYWAYVFARLKPGVSIEQARAAIAAPYRAIVNDVEAPLQKGMSEQTLARFRNKPIMIEPGSRGQSRMSGQAKAPLTLLLGVTAFVLLIACANIANLLLARGAARSGEMAVRLSIGAGRWQLIRQLLGESCLLALFGGLGGLVVAQWTLNLISTLLPPEAIDTITLSIDPTVMLFAAALAIGYRPAVRIVPGAAQHAPGSDLVAQRTERSTIRCARRGALPHLAGDRADRAVDGAAGVGRALHEEPGQRQPSRPRIETGQHHHVRVVAGAERLHTGTIAPVLRARRRASSRHCPASPASLVRRCR